MKAILVLFILLLPRFVFGQSQDEKYAIYSNYLNGVDKDYLEHDKGNHVFVIKISSDDFKNDYLSGISDIINDWKAYLKGDKVATSDLYFWFKSDVKFIKDTLWLPLIEKLNKNEFKSYPFKNRFAPDLHVFLLTYNEYNRYFDGHDFDWESFHENYSKDSGIVDISDVASDGRRAVFYCGIHNGPLNGGGELVFYYKDQNGWRLVKTVNLWMS